MACHYFLQVLWNPEDDKTETQQEIYGEYEACEVQLQERMVSRVEVDRYICWPIFLADTDTDTDISVSVLIISVSARTISVSASVLIEISVSVFNRYRS